MRLVNYIKIGSAHPYKNASKGSTADSIGVASQIRVVSAGASFASFRVVR